MTTQDTPAPLQIFDSATSTEPRISAGWLEPSTVEGAEYRSALLNALPSIEGSVAREPADRDFPVGGLEILRERGLLNAALPTRFGGMGVYAIHDLIVGAADLAAIDASLAIGVGMHTVTTHGLTSAWRGLLAAGKGSEAMELRLRSVAANRTLFAAAISERRQDMTRPTTRATRDGHGWRINGEKAFCTMGSAADVLNVAVSFRDDRGEERYGSVLIPADAPGVTICDDWDALGMVASASNSVIFENVPAPSGSVHDGWEAGVATPEWFERYLRSGLFHAAATLGVARAAHLATTDSLRSPSDQNIGLVADNVSAIVAMSASLSAAAQRIDNDNDCGTTGDPVRLFAQVQAVKSFIDRAAVDVVDRCLDISGGAGFANSHPLARAYRDVRAGGFMHPMGRNRAAATVGNAELGLLPQVS